MKTFLLALVMVMIGGLSSSGNAIAKSKSAKNDVLWVVYRDAQGELTKASEKFAKKMEKKASKVGYITLWLTANIEFNPYMDELTDQEIAEQEQLVQESLNAVLQPLVDVGSVWHPDAGRYIRGPGCLIRANAVGVAQLVQDSRILHITEG